MLYVMIVTDSRSLNILGLSWPKFYAMICEMHPFWLGPLLTARIKKATTQIVLNLPDDIG